MCWWGAHVAVTRRKPNSAESWFPLAEGAATSPQDTVVICTTCPHKNTFCGAADSMCQRAGGWHFLWHKTIFSRGVWAKGWQPSSLKRRSLVMLFFNCVRSPPEKQNANEVQRFTSFTSVPVMSRQKSGRFLALVDSVHTDWDSLIKEKWANDSGHNAEEQEPEY